MLKLWCKHNIICLLLKHFNLYWSKCTFNRIFYRYKSDFILNKAVSSSIPWQEGRWTRQLTATVQSGYLPFSTLRSEANEECWHFSTEQWRTHVSSSVTTERELQKDLTGMYRCRMPALVGGGQVIPHTMCEDRTGQLSLPQSPLPV